MTDSTEASTQEQDAADAVEGESQDRVVELVEFIARSLAANPDSVKATVREENDQTVITLELDEKDKGKVIGRQGRVAQAIRSLLRVAAVKQDTRIGLEIE